MMLVRTMRDRDEDQRLVEAKKAMPNQKERKKKSGQNKSKKMQRMRQSEYIQKAQAKPRGTSTD